MATGEQAQVIQLKLGRGAKTIYNFNIRIPRQVVIAGMPTLANFIIFSLAYWGAYQTKQKKH